MPLWFAGASVFIYVDYDFSLRDGVLVNHLPGRV